MGENSKIALRDLAIEVTRRCNLACFHCLRGDPEPVDISDYYLEELFSKVGRIGLLTITGGEPSLATDRIFKILELIKKHGVIMENFYLATNATNVTDDFIRVLMELYLACGENEVSGVDISNSIYHDNNVNFGDINHDVDKLKLLKFVQLKYSDKTLREMPNNLLHQGRCGSGREVEIDSIEVNIEEKEVSEGGLYLNCEGVIIAGCDFSFESQRSNKSIQVCKVEDLSIEVIDNWQRRASDERQEECN